MGKDSNRKWEGNKARGSSNFPRSFSSGGKKGIGQRPPQRPCSKEKDRRGQFQKNQLTDETKTDADTAGEPKPISETDGHCNSVEKDGVIKMVDESGRVTPEIAQIIGVMTMKDVVVLLMNIQKLMAQSPVAAHKVLSECPALCRSLLHAQIVTGVMNEQFRFFTALTSDSRELLGEMQAKRISQERATCTNVMDPFFNAPMDSCIRTPVSAPTQLCHGIPRHFRESSGTQSEEGKSVPASGKSQVSNANMVDIASTTHTEGRSYCSQTADEGVLKLAEEVVNHSAMLSKILTTPLEDIANFPGSQRRQVLQLRQILASRGYAVHD